MLFHFPIETPLIFTFPFKGKAGMGMGELRSHRLLPPPIPALTLPLKGRGLWLIAKCGDTGHYKNILKDDETKDFAQMEWDQAKSRMADKAKADKLVFYLYQSERYPQKYVEDLYNKVRNHNFSVNHSGILRVEKNVV